MEKFNRQSRKSSVDKFAEKVDVSEKWKAHEKEAAKSFNGETTIGSGNKDFYKGDVKSNVFLAECKTTVSRHWTFKVDWLEKINDEALGRMRFPAMHLRFDGIDQGSCEKDWVLLPDSVFKMMLEAFGEYNVG